MNDELLNEFINESREHLVTIEADLLTIEEGGVNINEELVNKVFRAAHSIKGGSSFFGLNKVKELAHKAETVLDLIRSKKMTPNAEITNILLAGFDKLREMINNTGESDNIDIADLVVSLTGLASSYLPQEQKATLNQNITLDVKGESSKVTIPHVDFERAKRSGQYIYLIDMDLIHDVERQGKNVLSVFKDFEATGEILDLSLDFEQAGTLDGPVGNQLPLRLVFATIASPDIIDSLFTVDKEKIKLVYDSYDSKAAENQPVPAPAPKPEPKPEPKPAPKAEPRPEPEPEHDTQADKKQDIKPANQAPASKAAQASPSSPGDETLRVNVGLLEILMNLAGELVLSRNQLHAAVAQNNFQGLSVADQRINQVTAELQDAIMQTRLQPIGNVFSKFPRVVRDMANLLHKDIQLDIRGKDVALDRSLIEGLSDPLTHMVRNAVDHGIEKPEEREKTGKDGVGTIIIEAKHEAGQVVVEIGDDGKGIDPNRVANSALAKGLITAEKLRGMSDQDKIALIFLPGLSTSEKVTEISGRGVGMDVVKTNLDRLGGKVEIKSELGKGSLFRIKLPLTLAIIPSLIISVEGEQFAIPQINIEELLRVPREEVKRRIELVGGSEVLLLRDKIIPLVRFASLLGLTPTYYDPKTGAKEFDRRVTIADRRSPKHPSFPDDGGNMPVKAATDFVRTSDGRRKNATSALEIAVVTTGTMQYGLVVDSFHNTEEIVVKPLGRHLKGLREYAGATILGDGMVALILDIGGLATKADLTFVSGTPRAVEHTKDAEKTQLDDVHSLLLFHNAPDELCAIPLSIVLRLERITPSQLEMKGGRRTFQYRGYSLPLVTLSDVAQVSAVDNNKDMVVVVSRIHGKEVGLLGSMPVDVTEVKMDVDQMTHRQRGITGSAIVGNKTTLIVDMFELVESAYPEWKEEKEKEKTVKQEQEVAVSGNTKKCILLAEDSDFFRMQVKKYLEEDGYEVFDAPDGEDAWTLLLEHVGEVTAIVTDVEMPRLTGLGLTARVRADARTAKLPVIALTSLAGEDDMMKGRAIGVDNYQVKLDRDELLLSLRDLISKSAGK